MTTSQKTAGHLLALFAVAVWGSCYVLTKEMLTAFTAVQITPLRMALAYATLWLLRPKPLHLPWREEWRFALIGITGGSFYFFLQNTALTYTYAANVSILVSLSPLITVLLTALLRREETPGRFVWLGSLVAIAGVVLVVGNGVLDFHANLLGDALALGAAAFWAIYSLLIKPYIDRYDSFLVTRRVMLWAFLTAVPLMLLTDGMPDLAPLFTNANVLWSWLFLSVLGNAVCFAAWNVAFRRLGVVATNNYLYASPFVTLAVGWLLLDERITLMGVAGAVLITLGLILADRK